MAEWRITTSSACALPVELANAPNHASAVAAADLTLTAVSSNVMSVHCQELRRPYVGVLQTTFEKPNALARFDEKDGVMSYRSATYSLWLTAQT